MTSAESEVRPRAAEQLLGRELSNGWQVVERLERPDDATGGHFSVPYVVERDNGMRVERGFLKALDFTVASELGMPIVDALGWLTAAYRFERDLVLRCSAAGMTNVITGIDSGEITISDHFLDPILANVPYIIFELADGDVRTIMAKAGGQLDTAFSLRLMHGIANGIRQLHQAGIGHQDLKPSNSMAVQRVGKLGDLGRASLEDRSGMFDGDEFMGDLTYAPPEVLYGYSLLDTWTTKRANDSYQLGSVFAFLIVGSGITALVEAFLPPAFHWRTWPRDYVNVLPFVREAFDQVISAIEIKFDPAIRGSAIATLRELCDPDPRIRGFERHTDGRRLAMERYVTIFDRLARTMELAAFDRRVR